MVKSCRWTYEWNKSVTDLLSKLLGYKSEKSYVETRQSQILRIGWYWKAFLPELSKRRVSMMTIIGASVYHGRNQSMIAIRNLTKLCETWKILLMLLQNTTWWGKLPWSSSKSFTFITATSLLMAHLIIEACWYAVVCQSLVLNYQGLYISYFAPHGTFHEEFGTIECQHFSQNLRVLLCSYHRYEC